jgi:hypothetical protein
MGLDRTNALTLADLPVGQNQPTFPLQLDQRRSSNGANGSREARPDEELREGCGGSSLSPPELNPFDASQILEPNGQ